MADPAIWGNQTVTQGQQDTTAQNQSTSTNQNLYNQGQQALQGQLPGVYSNLISGGLQSFTDPTALMNQYNQQFQNTVAPGLAAQYGAGSPQIAAQQNQGMVNLLGNQYNQGISNYLNTLGQAGGFGTTALGQTGTTSGTANQQASGSNSATTSYGPTLLGLLLGLSQNAGGYLTGGGIP